MKVMLKDHPKHQSDLMEMMEKLRSFIPSTMAGFDQLHRSATATGALNSRTKQLIALGIAITVRCDGCIAFHVHDALESGATPEEIVETIGVAILMGGGPAVMYGCEALEALQQFKRLEESKTLV